MMSTQAKWDAIYSSANVAEVNPIELLTEHPFLLPKTGNALDLACGLGANALWLAGQGLNVDAWDISQIALQKLQHQTQNRPLSINTRQCDIQAEILPKQYYDVIVLSRFLDRSLCRAIMDALKPAGLLFYQTFIRNKLDSHNGPNNPDYLLNTNELLQLFSGLNVVYYQEYARIGELSHGNRNEAGLIAQKA